ncbi:MAG: sulfatase [Planctomycetota bacterium]
MILDELPTRIAQCRSKRPNVLLIVLDTVRSDHLSCYGYPRQTTPNLDAFAAGSRRYTNVLSPGGWTLPSHSSLFTGLPASAHGARFTHQFLDERPATIAQELREAGYQTAAWSCNPYYAGPRCGLDRGFAAFSSCGSAVQMHQELGEWFRRKYRPDKPFFVFLNYIEAHAPYRLPPERAPKWATKEIFAKWRDIPSETWSRVIDHMVSGQDLFSPEEFLEAETLYDEEIAYLDTKLGQLFDFLSRNGFEDKTLAIVTADHGEHFNEHHMTEHSFSLYEPIVRVPLIVRFGDRFPAGEDGCLVQSHDVFPTILDVAEVQWKRQSAHHCESLPVGEGARPRLAVAEYLAPCLGHIDRVVKTYPRIDCSRFLRSLRAVQFGGMKLILPSRGEPELYSLEKDPLELRNLAGERPDVVSDLSARLGAWLTSFEHYSFSPTAQDDVQAQTSEQEFRAARGLGYVK